jgi:hypothetical protein
VPATGAYTFREHLFASETGWPGSFMGTAWSVKSVPNSVLGAGEVIRRGWGDDDVQHGQRSDVLRLAPRLGI